MSSLVLDLQQEILKPDCDILNALRKAHIIAMKLKLSEFDAWIQSELNGYETNQDLIPDYRKISGQLKAWNPYHGWIPVIMQDSGLEEMLCHRKMEDSIGDIIELYSKSKGNIVLTFSAWVAAKLDSLTNAPFNTKYSLHVSSHQLKSIVDKVINCLMEWTLKLEENGIVGENMRFNETESASAKDIPQQINYYGPVINGNISSSQIVSGNNSTVTYSAQAISDAINEIRDSLEKEQITGEDMENALELLSDISKKIEQNKKPSIIKSALVGLKDFILATGANVTAALITAKIQGLF
jgi:hypothetical protein